jgi:phage-related protein
VAKDLRFDVLAQAKEKGFAKVSGEVKGLHSHMKGLITLGAGLLAGGGLIDFLKGSVSEGIESQKVGAQTTAVIKSTGGAAHVTAKQFSDLATQISLKTGIDDEQIQSSENMLATFTNVRNEVGKGNDIFSQATSVITDMSVALGQDSKNSAIQLGKALNDPIHGITALQRVGVTFTDKQKAMIKKLVETGDTLGAQKIILRELNKEFGGSAAAQATAGEKMQVAWGNLKEQIGTALIPILTKLANWLTVTVLPAFSNVVAWVQAHWPQISAKISAVWNGGILPVFNAIKGFITDKLIPAFKATVQWVRDHWPEIKNAISTAWSQIKPVLTSFIDLLKTLWHDVLAPVVRWVRDNWPTISTVLKTVGGLVKVSLGTMLTEIKLTFKAITAAIKVVNWAWKTFGGPIEWAWKHVIKPVIDAIMWAINRAQNALDSLTGKVVQGQGSWAGGLITPNHPGGTRSPDSGTRGHASGGFLTEGWNRGSEHGAEWMYKRGSQVMVYPTGSTRAPGGGGTVVLEIRSGGSKMDELLVEIIRRSVRVLGGGDVQVALGR